jgi:hypothetical protein
MATIRIRNRRRDEQAIPDLCIRCARPTDYRKTKQFSWYPPWIIVLLLLVGPIPYIIVALILTKKRTLEVPLCDQHRHHFLWAPLFIGLGLVLIIILAIGTGIVGSQASQAGDDTLFGLLCGGGVLFFLVWLIVAIILQNRLVKPKEITDDEITLTGVAEEFVEEFENEMEARRASRLDREAQEGWAGGGSGRARDEEERGRDRYRREDDEGEDDRDRYSRRR